MKKIIYYCFFVMVLLSQQVNATHNRGYEMTLVSLGNDLYKFRLITYGDPTGISSPISYQLYFYRNSDNAPAPITYLTVNRISSINISTLGDCPPLASPFTTKKNIYESSSTNLSSFTAAAGYYAVIEDCCRESGIINIVNSSSTGILYTMDFPSLGGTSITRNNRAPQFVNNPYTSLVVGRGYELDWSAIDLDADSLVYKFVNPRNGVGGALKPFIIAQYAAGFKLDSNIADGDPDVTINSQTGKIIYRPTKLGVYAIAVKVEEWKRAVGSSPAYKIGEIIREMSLQVGLNTMVAPVTTDDLGQKGIIVDSVYFDSESTIIFTAQDANMDSLFMVILPDTSSTENIFNANTFAARWGTSDTSLLTGEPATNLVISGRGLVSGKFRWKTKCSAARAKPYKFRVLVRDNTCPIPLYDTTEVFIYVLKTANNPPFFSSPDTIKSHTIKKYYINAGDNFELAGDSLIKTVDLDSPGHTVIIYLKPFESNGSINQEVIFALSPSFFESTAIFKWQSDCRDGRSEPYKFTLLAVDNDCLKPDSVSFELHIHVAAQISASKIDGSKIVNDTSLIYAYSTDNDSGVNYYWYGTNATIVSGQGTDSVNVKWHNTEHNQLVCVFSSARTNCVDSSVFDVNGVTGVNSVKESFIKIYPNPTDEVIHIDGMNKNESTIVSIFDVQGKLIKTEMLIESGVINLANLEQGVYVVKVGGIAHRIAKI